ncbi:hypothetical protein ES703_00047 [subsurface metagenome]
MGFANPPVTAAGGQYIRSATLVVSASDSKDTRNVDYVCDGTDDQVEINAAIAALPDGGSVYLCGGTYNICGPIVIDKDNISLVGCGANTLITIPDGLNAAMNFIEAANRTNLLFKDLRVDGNQANQTAGVMIGINFNSVTHSKIAKCWIENVRGYGIALNLDNDNNAIEGCTSSGHSLDGIGLYRSSGNALTGNICQDNNEVGIRLDDFCHNDTVTGNICDSNGYQGIRVDKSCHYNTLVSNIVTGSGEEGIYVIESNGNVLDGNLVYGSAYEGIYLSSSNDCTVVGNSVINNGLDADVTYDGIRLTTSDYNNIQDNLIRTTLPVPPAPNRQRYGINVSNAACDGNLVKNNDLHQSGITALFNDAGTDTKLPELWVNSIFDDSDANASLSNIGPAGSRYHVSIEMADTFDVTVRFNFRVPSDFHELVRARVVVVPEYIGPPSNMRRGVEAIWGECSELVGTDTGTIAAGEVALTGGNTVNCLDINAALAGITAGDHVGVAFTRYGSHVNDTVGAPVHILVFWMQYV